MTRPRQVVPGWTYMISRRCTQRQYLLRPSRPLSKRAFRHRRASRASERERIFRLEELGEEAQLYLYAIGLYAEEHDFEPHAATQMGNHHHQVGTDVGGALPKYTKMLHGNVARAMNVKLDRGEDFWAGATSYSAVKLEGRQAILEKLAYVITNPVAAGLCARPEEWPGVCILPEDIGREIVVQRPPWFFRRTGRDGRGRARGEPLPEVVRLTFTPPPEFADMPLPEFRELLRAHVEARIAEIHEERRRRNRVWRDAGDLYEATVGLDPFGSPAPRNGAHNRINPRVACRDRWKRVERLEANARFLTDHREARDAFREGDRSVRFPPGTWAAVVVYGALVRPARLAG